VEKVTASIDTFELDPTYEHFLNANQLIKALKEDIDFNKVNDNPQYQGELTNLANLIVRFWKAAQTSINGFLEDKKITLYEVAQISYSLEACIRLNQRGDFFKTDDWKELHSAIWKFMHVLINRIRENGLLDNPGKSNVGNVLALLSWIIAGIQHPVPVTEKNSSSSANSKMDTLLSGLGGAKDRPGLNDLTERAIDYLLNSFNSAFDTRQVCKMVLLLQRMISAGYLRIQESHDKPLIDPTKFAEKLVQFANSSLLQVYKEFGHDSDPNYVNPIAVNNLCSGLRKFFAFGILNWKKEDHLNLAKKTAIFIRKACKQSQADEHFVKTCRAFVNEAISSVSKDSSQPFNEALTALDELEKN
jgi:hypothetical protein